jgi:hypothetical protein
MNDEGMRRLVFVTAVLTACAGRPVSAGADPGFESAVGRIHDVSCAVCDTTSSAGCR